MNASAHRRLVTANHDLNKSISDLSQVTKEVLAGVGADRIAWLKQQGLPMDGPAGAIAVTLQVLGAVLGCLAFQMPTATAVMLAQRAATGEDGQAMAEDVKEAATRDGVPDVVIMRTIVACLKHVGCCAQLLRAVSSDAAVLVLLEVMGDLVAELKPALEGS